jgi:isopentenyl-diphosphate delta-isomerase
MSVDEQQLQYMDQEFCILLNTKDEIIGKDSKKNCHLKVNEHKNLHRAFSVFLFNSNGELLLQQRAAEKITFPLFWTNTCCSHPISNFEEETNGVDGVIIAAQRKLLHELGIPMDSYKTEDFNFVTKILYKADANEIWMENEIDYILLVKSKKEIKYDLNLNECKDVMFVTQKKVLEMFDDSSLLITPWFKLIVKNLLFGWWDSLMKDEKVLQDGLIHNFYPK